MLWLQIWKICTIMHPTGLHGYISGSKGGETADNNKGGGNDKCKSELSRN